jgi:hypothetical protein
MKRVTIAFLPVVMLCMSGCIKHGRYTGAPQPKPYPVRSLSTEKDLALAAMVRVVLSQLPANSTACLSFTSLRHGFYFQHDADSILRRASGGIAKILTETDCPPSYGHGGFYVVMPNAPKRPEGYVDPYHVTIEDIHYDGANQVRAIVTAKVPGYHQIRYCYASRTSRHNWRAACPGGSNIILSSRSVPAGSRSPVTGYRLPETGLVYDQ